MEVKMQTKTIELNDFGNRGKWKQKELKAWLRSEFSTPKMAKSVDLKEFYKSFYDGSKVIKYIGYYCRKHVLDLFSELDFTGLAEVRGTELKIARLK
jgi:hypothetical protein